MAPLWLYGIVPADGDPPARPGVAGERPRILRHRGLGAVHGIVAAAPGISAATLRRHDAVVQELLRLFPAVLPARYGETTDDADELRATLESRADALRQRLAELTGHVQMTLRVFARGAAPARVAGGEQGDPAAALPPPPPDAGPGSIYLHERRAALARTQVLPEIESLRRALGPLVRRQRIVRTDAARLVGTAYDLVAAASVDAYREIVDSHAGIEGYRLSVSGPRPPWAFTESVATPPPGERR